MTTLYRHLPSRRICKLVPIRRDDGHPGGLRLADGLVMIEWTRRAGDAMQGMLAVPVTDIEPLDGQDGPPDAHLDIFRPVVAASG